MAESDVDINVDGKLSPDKRSKSKMQKQRKSIKPSLNVLTVMNIVDCTKIIKNDISSKLSKNVGDFSHVSARHIADCSSLKKLHIAEHLLSLVKLCDEIPRHSLELPSQPDFSSIESNISQSLSKHMAELNKSNNFAFETIQEQIKRLEQLTADTTSNNRPVSSHQPVPPAPPRPVTKLVTDPYIDLIPDFISDSLTTTALCEYLSSQCNNKFTNEGDRAVIYYGPHDYKYSGKVHRAQKPPELISAITSDINKRFPDKKVNSCLVTRYLDGRQHCPPHHDDEDEIAPNSNIYTLSLGAERNMLFEIPSSSNNSEKKLLLPHNSLLIFSHLSQAVYKHSIPCDSSTTVRFSLTFRDISPYNANSTVILGDSNIKHLKFGESKDAFGKWMPGKVVKCSKVQDIPPPAEIGLYKNIVVHVGINDVKYANKSSIPATVKLLEQKCNAIIDVFPSSNLYICPLLPTKDPDKNVNVFMMNRAITELSHKHPKILLMSNYFTLFSDAGGVMRPALGRFQGGLPFDGDDLHLGQVGIKLLAKCIKHCVLKQKGPITQFMNYVVSNIDMSIGNDRRRRQSSGATRSPLSASYARALGHRPHS